MRILDEAGTWARVAALLAGFLAAGCRADTSVAPRTPPTGAPAKLVPAPVEQHPRPTPHYLPR